MKITMKIMIDAFITVVSTKHPLSQMSVIGGSLKGQKVIDREIKPIE